MRFTTEWLQNREARDLAKLLAKTQAPYDAVDLELPLHGKVIEECERRGWICLHGATHVRAMRTAGEFDCTILADGGRVYFIELKRKTGKLTGKQPALHAQARKLGHATHVVRSMAEFFSIIDGKMP